MEYEEIDYSEKGFAIVEELQKFKENVTKKQLVTLLKSSKNPFKNKITYEKLKSLSEFLKSEKEKNIEALVETMISSGLLIPFTEKFRKKFYV